MVSGRTVALSCGALAATVVVYSQKGEQVSLRGRRLQYVEGVNGIAGAVNNGAQSVIDFITGTRADAHAKIRGSLVDAHGAVRDGLSDVRESLADAHGALRDGLVDAHGALRDGFADARGALRDGVVDAHGAIREKAQEAHGAIRDGVRYGVDRSRDAAKFGYDTYNAVQDSPIQQFRNGLLFGPTLLIDSRLSVPFVLLQAAFGVLYFFMVVRFYPYWNGPTPESCQLQAEPAPMATTMTSPWNCVLSWCCPQARAAHTLDRTGILDYWVSLVAMLFCPFCTLCWANACTDLNPKLGGQQENVIVSMACTWLCPCCVIAQDAESLDAATRVNTTLCGVAARPGGFPTPYNPYAGYNPNVVVPPMVGPTPLAGRVY